MKKVRLGMIGCGGMSRYHGKVFASQVPEAEVVALCDSSPAALARYQLEVFDPVKQKPAQFADYRQMLAAVKLDGVFIVTPHTQHYEQTLAALDAGMHVMLEKPMVTAVAEARQLVAYPLKPGQTFGLAFPGPFTAEYAYIRGLVERGELGEINTVHANLGQQWLKGTRGTWRQDPALAGGGFAYDSGAHLFNAMLYLTNLAPSEVFAWTSNRGAPVEILMAATVRFANGALGTASLSGEDPRGWEECITLGGTAGVVRTGIHGNRLEQWDDTGKLVRYPRVEPVASLHQRFVDCILGRSLTPCAPVWGLKQALLMEALYESARRGQPVTVAAE